MQAFEGGHPDVTICQGGHIFCQILIIKNKLKYIGVLLNHVEGVPRFCQSSDGGCPDSANPQMRGVQMLPILGWGVPRYCQSLDGGCPDSANPRMGGAQMLPILGWGVPRFYQSSDGWCPDAANPLRVPIFCCRKSKSLHPPVMFSEHSLNVEIYCY